MRVSSAFALSLFCISSFAVEPNWNEGAVIPETGRPNPYLFADEELPGILNEGRLHALIWPILQTGVTIPYKPLVKLLKKSADDPVKKKFIDAFQLKKDVRTPDELFEWLGLHSYPSDTDKGIYGVPFPDGKRPDYRMGVTLQNRNGTLTTTFGCASCHTGNLFGRKILGMTNRFPRANHFFIAAKGAVAGVPGILFQLALGTTSAERKIYEETRENAKFLAAREPQVLGLDTSLAHTALSLAHRAPDGWATKDLYYTTHPSPEILADRPSDSKPMVWWNVKYKNRWLSDGSAVSGNPVATNFLWNEVGRGTDLKDLTQWFESNQRTIETLTTAVFASQAPRYTDFFPAESISVVHAKKGEQIFQANCMRCHGSYKKGWSLPNESELTPTARLETVEVKYHSTTPVVDVGTDPMRYLGMESLAKRLNPLEFSARLGVKVVPQKGYVPPPLVGIWARWPYFHNNSVPSLCAVLTRANDRPSEYFAGEALDPNTDFDPQCNGYPSGEKTPPSWKADPERRYDTTIAGMGNLGHDEGIFIKQGKEILSADDKADLILFLQTL